MAMSILLYCIAERSASLASAMTGIAELPVLRLESAGLSVFVSESATSEPWTRIPLRQAAAGFHSIVQKLFQSTAIIAFRFPTILESRAELMTHLKTNSELYSGILAKFRDSVQMEALISHSGTATKKQCGKGSEYLRERQKCAEVLAGAASALKARVEPVATDWRHRSAQNALRCFVLIERKSVVEFHDRMRTLSVPEEISVRVSGPWPVSEFLELSHVRSRGIRSVKR